MALRLKPVRVAGSNFAARPPAAPARSAGASTTRVTVKSPPRRSSASPLTVAPRAMLTERIGPARVPRDGRRRTACEHTYRRLTVLTTTPQRRCAMPHAIQFAEFGPPEVLRLVDVPELTAGE